MLRLLGLDFRKGQAEKCGKLRITNPPSRKETRLCLLNYSKQLDLRSAAETTRHSFYSIFTLPHHCTTLKPTINMSLPVGRILRSAAGRTPTPRILGSVPVSTPNTTPSRLRHARDLSRTQAVAGFHTVPPSRQQGSGRSSSNNNNNDNKKTQNVTEKKSAEEATLVPTAGAFARTDDSITVEYPPEHQLPASVPVEGTDRAGAHIFPTLATFSLQGKVGVVTGGARGLGLVMGRECSRPKLFIAWCHANQFPEGLVISGADLAIVDLNSTCAVC